jgi:hypothetical protein
LGIPGAAGRPSPSLRRPCAPSRCRPTCPSLPPAPPTPAVLIGPDNGPPDPAADKQHREQFAKLAGTKEWTTLG